MEDYTNYYSSLLVAKLPILVYTGEFDMQDGPVTQTEWMRNIKALKDLDPEYWNTAR